MKLRIKGNSIRIRLSMSEVERFAREGAVSETLSFGPNELRYVLKRSGTHDTLSAAMSGDTLTMYLPCAMADVWTETSEVGFSYRQDNGVEGGLFLLLEKDFQCLDDSIEDQSDNFPNPLANKIP